MRENTMRDQEELKRYLTEEITFGRDPDHNDDFKTALRECTDDEFLYLAAENAPQHRFFSYGDIAAASIRSEEYRYAVVSSSIRGRRTLIHDLAVSRELDELLAVRILLTDPDDESKRESLYVIKSEALLMLACLKSVSYRVTSRERLQDIGSAYPDRYYKEMDQNEREAAVKEWYAEACVYAERLLETDKEMNERVSLSVDIDSARLIGFLAACHPDKTKRAVYAKRIPWESIAAYVGAVTEDADVRRILSSRIRREDLLDSLPYCNSGGEPFLTLIKDTEEKRTAFCLEVFKNTEREETREYLLERMEEARLEIK